MNIENGYGSTIEEGGERKIWSFKQFREWKKEFYIKYQEQYGRTFKENFPKKLEREKMYKILNGYENFNVFGTGNTIHSVSIDLIRFYNAKRVADLVKN